VIGHNLSVITSPLGQNEPKLLIQESEISGIITEEMVDLRNEK